VLLDYENFIVIHGYGEAEFSDDYPRWVSEVKQIITKIRNAGYKCPIDAISTTYGRDPRPIIQYGQSLVDHDPLRNLILGCQMYWGTYYEEVYGMTIAQACAKFTTLGFPVQWAPALPTAATIAASGPGTEPTKTSSAACG
jgi:hypothetical protein